MLQSAMLRLAWFVLLAACVAGPRTEEDPPPDGDHDGLPDADDCFPADPALPNLFDECDGIDSDCDGTTDEDAIALTWYGDADGDTYGDAEDVLEACAQPEGYVANADDCDPGDEATFPGAPELCDLVDSDCDGAIDDEDDPSRTPTWYRDADGDGWGVDTDTMQACYALDGYVALEGDCDDTNVALNPGAAEVCDEADVDENCNGLADDEDWAAGGTLGFTDADGDGWGDAVVWPCDPMDGVVAEGGDCDDADPTVYPTALETCGDGLDTDCDGEDLPC